MGQPLNSELVDFFNSGLQLVSPSMEEPFTFPSGSTNPPYYANFAEEVFQEQLEGGGFKNIKGSTALIRNGELPNVPRIGEKLVKDSTVYRVLTVKSDLVSIELSLIDTNH